MISLNLKSFKVNASDWKILIETNEGKPSPTIPTGPLEMLMNTATNKLLSSYKCPFKKDGLTEVGHPKENTMEENDSYNNFYITISQCRTNIRIYSDIRILISE